MKPDENPRNLERNNYSTRKKRRYIKQIKKSVIKMEHYKLSKLLNDSTIWKFVTNINRNKWFIKWSIFC